MMEADENGDIPLLVALKSIRSKAIDRINTRPNDQVGIILFGTVSFSFFAIKATYKYLLLDREEQHAKKRSYSYFTTIGSY